MCPVLERKIDKYSHQFNGIESFDSIQQVVKNCSTYFDEHGNSYKDNDRTTMKWSTLSKAYGIYMFIDSSGCQILYIGEAHKQTLKKRICQHFHSKDKGGLKYKLTNSNNQLLKTLYNNLEKSSLYVIKAKNASPKKILYFESFLIGALQPPINFCKKI